MSTDRSSKGLPKAAGYAVDPESFPGSVWEEIKSFVEFDEEDRQRLTELYERCNPAINAIVDRFYDHLLSFEDTQRILRDHDIRGHLKEAQRAYLHSLCAGDYGRVYLSDRIRVGLTHERIGLGLRWFLGAYWIYMRELAPLVLDDVPPDRTSRLLSLFKIFLLDMQIISESYVGKTMTLVREQNERLEDIILARTRQLARWERLAAVGSMSAKVAHEIRNPLSSISLNVELLADELRGFQGTDTTEALELLGSIEGELERLKRITDDYLSFARLPRLELTPTEMGAFLETIVAFMAPEFERSGIVVDLHAESDLPAMTVDRNQFRQVLLNVLRNAIEAMPQGGRLRLQLARDGDGLLLAVEDTGAGIDTADREKAFDPFFTTKDTGTGLGLPFVQQVVREHRGTVEIEAGRDGGVRVLIRLPQDLMMRGQANPAGP